MRPVYKSIIALRINIAFHGHILIFFSQGSLIVMKGSALASIFIPPFCYCCSIVFQSVACIFAFDAFGTADNVSFVRPSCYKASKQFHVNRVVSPVLSRYYRSIGDLNNFSAWSHSVFLVIAPHALAALTVLCAGYFFHPFKRQ